MDSPNTTLRTAGDIISHSVWIGAIIKFLPPIAAALSIAWSAVQLYDRFFKKKKHTDQPNNQR